VGVENIKQRNTQWLRKLRSGFSFCYQFLPPNWVIFPPLRIVELFGRDFKLEVSFSTVGVRRL
jgi:hypothetical protein